MSEATIIRTEFRCIIFEEFSMKEGGPTYSVAKNEIHNNIITNKYGTNWRTTWRQIESETERKELEDRKRKYWMCPKGSEHCHKKTTCNTWCSKTCNITHYHRNFGVSKKYFTGCIDGHEICHDGIIQCPSCQDANIVCNPRKFKCDWCNEYFHSLTLRQFAEHRILCSAGFPPYYLDMQKRGVILGPGSPR